MGESRNTVSKTKKSAQTQARIISSYLSLMQEKHFEKITVKEVVDKANITRGTFYLYFNDIYEMQQYIEDELLAHFNSFCLDVQEPSCALQCNLTDWGFSLNPPAALMRWFEYCKQHGEAIKALLGSYGDPYFVIKLRNQMRVFVNQLMDKDNMPHDQLREYYLETFVELNFLLARQWLNESSESSLTIERMTTILNTIRVGANTLSYFERKQNK
ncbi:TetR/AcrR family transcriptional regulator [Clostridium sp. SYSU_GA19001]|uniref:TetR/AcrR family transcriptional regulator n=1 Tax=Clostridium caldaquaticum TaxID=2940653 RepID=UPI0020772E7F|nr:TetR/AcrR family transcriptional regulator [Clostridium caldaquaticum]MCM8709915.1 TetR/AcrR family transcriptional regulator [Clostridium caldaquaticum]